MNSNQNLSLGETARCFLVNLPPEEGKVSQQEVYKFVRWYGGERPLAGLSAPEVANYAERLSLSDSDYSRKLTLIRAFLNYAKNEGWIGSNLAAHLKVKKKGKNKAQSLVRPGMASTVSLTRQGYDALKVEIDTLKSKRVQIIEEVRKAAADKDFRENAPLEAAREQHGQLESRIKELEEMMKLAVVIDETQKPTVTVRIGDSVILQDLASGEELSYKIVSPREVDPGKGKISHVSPVGKAIIGRKEGEEIAVTIPAGKLRYRIKLVGC